MGMRTDAKLFTSLRVSLYEFFFIQILVTYMGIISLKVRGFKRPQCFCSVMRFILSYKNKVSTNIWRNGLLFNVSFLPVIIVTSQVIGQVNVRTGGRNHRMKYFLLWPMPISVIAQSDKGIFSFKHPVTMLLQNIRYILHRELIFCLVDAVVGPFQPFKTW